MYAVPPTPDMTTRGEVTGTQTLVMGTSGQYLSTVNFYDDRGRAIQAQSVNYTGGVDTMTTQYDFTGKPLRSLLGQAKVTNTAQYHRVLTKTNYDAGFRVTSVWKNIDGAASDQIIDSMQYNELGQLHNKLLGKDAVTGAPLDNVVYDYNIRGWLTGMNKAYVDGMENHYFGMQLGYDQGVEGPPSTQVSQFNGNICGEVWKTAGDGLRRKYDFKYDNVNRITRAEYNKNSSGDIWDTNTENFGMWGFDQDNGYGIKYDENGNMQMMILAGQKGVGAPQVINAMRYTYFPNSNKLQQVSDDNNDPTTQLGNFHYDGSTKTGTDYGYDGNGNLVLDNNKKIDKIAYNYLNLPQLVHINGKGNILYTYDAAGTKLTKQVIDSAAGMATTTLYLDGFQYQRRTPMASPSGGVDTLQFAGHEEGRARWAFHKYLNGDSAYAWEYDFYERDHLGNTRVLLSQEKDTAQYLASMEAAYRHTEDALFYGIDSTCVPRPAGYPDDQTYTNPNDSVSRVNGSGPKVGPAIILKVMSGDKVDLGVQYYFANGTGSTPSPLSPQDLLYSLASGMVGISPAMGESFSTLSNPSGSPLLGALMSSISNQSGSGGSLPQAYLNWVLLDDHFNYVSDNGQSGALQVQAAGTQGSGALQPPLAQSGISIKKSGYLYIYVSNTTPGWDVFFDNLSVTHTRGPLLEEDHYYPFGLTMAGISDKAVKTKYAENKYRFNKGSELQNKEFSDGSGLEMYETHLRELDPQLGRWWQIDPVFSNGVDGDDEVNEAITEGLKSQSPYACMDNNPVLRNDPNGDCPLCVIAILIGLLTTSEPAVAPSSNHAHDLQDNQAINKAHTDATLHAAGSLLTGGAKMVMAVGKAIFDSRQEAPDPQKSSNAPAQQGSGGNTGKGKNNLQMDKDAQGDHSTFKRDDKGNIYKYQEWKKNDQNPNKFDPGKRFDGGKPDGSPGTPHVNKKTGESISTPHVNERGGNGRSAENNELPDNSRFKPSN
ncbi:MAG TPA: hypothetical protein VG605_11510 [Puia sp.]|nr:hypothetical protein [Puia sp.]